MDNKCILFLLFYLINTSFQKIDEIQFIDNLNSSNYIIPVNYKNYLYIIAGESEKSISSDNIYKRVILKYEVNSGKMIGNFTINSTFPFANPEVVFAGDDIEESLLTITYDSIGLYDFKNNKETIYPAKGNFIMDIYILKIKKKLEFIE
jgi:hypothetical protein